MRRRLGFWQREGIERWGNVRRGQVTSQRKEVPTGGAHLLVEEERGKIPFRVLSCWALGRIGEWAESFPSAFFPFSLFLSPFFSGFLNCFIYFANLIQPNQTNF
jgi:hypothetical protein